MQHFLNVVGLKVGEKAFLHNNLFSNLLPAKKSLSFNKYTYLLTHFRQGTIRGIYNTTILTVQKMKIGYFYQL